jgi:hypothetical protein
MIYEEASCSGEAVVDDGTPPRGTGLISVQLGTPACVTYPQNYALQAIFNPCGTFLPTLLYQPEFANLTGF